MAFTTIILGNLGLILTSRSRTRLIVKTLSQTNPALWSIVGSTLAALALVLYVPYLSELFRVAPLDLAALLLCLAAATIGALSLEFYKFFSPGR